VAAARPTILVTGASGQLGGELASALNAYGSVVATDRSALDLADPDRIVAVMRQLRPALVVNAAAYTAVDRAESEPALAFAINARAPAILAEEARRAGALLVHYSTDYVFDGSATAPYAEEAPACPLNVYGQSKHEGELAIAASGAHALVFRTSWVYAAHGRNFLLTMRRLATERDEIAVVADQIGTPNWSRTLAQATATLVARGLPYLAERTGLYHMSAHGATSWHGFARAIFGDREPPFVRAIATAEYPTPARRPLYGVLSTRRFQATFGDGLPPWRDALAACLATLPSVAPGARP
jgi:dTDP-4-dehydrorhamnose reductase